MKNPRKISAFTLTELLVALAISTIVVGMAYTVLTLFGHNLQLIQNNYSRSTELDLLEQQITIDFNRYHRISYQNNAYTIRLKTPIDSITYEFTEASIIRNLDTLISEPYEKTFFYQGTEINQGEIDAIKLEFGEDQNQGFLFFYKEHDAVHYMNNNGN